MLYVCIEKMIFCILPLVVVGLRSSAQTEARLLLPSADPIKTQPLPDVEPASFYRIQPDCYEYPVLLETDNGKVLICPTSKEEVVLPGSELTQGYLIDGESQRAQVFVKFHEYTSEAHAITANEEAVYQKLKDAPYVLELLGHVTRSEDKSFQLGSRGEYALPGLLFKGESLTPLVKYVHDNFIAGSAVDKGKLFDCIFKQLLEAAVDISARGVRRPSLYLKSVLLVEGQGAEDCPQVKVVDFSQSSIDATVNELDLFLSTLLSVEQLSELLHLEHSYMSASHETIDLIIRVVKRNQAVRPNFVESCNRLRTEYTGRTFQTWCGVASLFLDQ